MRCVLMFDGVVTRSAFLWNVPRHTSRSDPKDLHGTLLRDLLRVGVSFRSAFRGMFLGTPSEAILTDLHCTLCSLCLMVW